MLQGRQQLAVSSLLTGYFNMLDQARTSSPSEQAGLEIRCYGILKPESDHA